MDVEKVEVTQADRAFAERFRRGSGGKYDQFVDKMAYEAARHRLAALEASGVRELVEALEPFAKLAVCQDAFGRRDEDDFCSRVLHSDGTRTELTVGDLRRARALVSQYRGGKA